MSRKAIGVAVGIIFKNGDVLCCQRQKGARYGLQWEFPGGKIRENEEPADCLKRELLEELNISIKHPEPYETRIQEYPDDGIFKVNYFLVKDFTGTLTNNAFESIRWIPPRNFDTIHFLDGNKPVLEKLKEDFI
jgi:8-oxo-dGTP diphosphatase